MALIEWGCKEEGFGRPLQPATTNRPRRIISTGGAITVHGELTRPILMLPPPVTGLTCCKLMSVVRKQAADFSIFRKLIKTVGPHRFKLCLLP